MSQKLAQMLILLSSLVVCVACSSTTDKPAPGRDADSSADTDDIASEELDTTIDTPGDLDTSADDLEDETGDDLGDGTGDSADAVICTGECTMTELVADFGGETQTLTTAAYGLTAPDAAGEPWTLYVEAWKGGFSGCPEMESPTPDHTLVLSGVELPFESNAGSDDGVSGSLFDYTGNLLSGESPVASAVNVTVQPVAVSVCVDCFGQPFPSDPDGFVAMELAAAFGEGQLTGHVYATHCDSLDSAP